MMQKLRQKDRQQVGSAMILVVVVTVLLAIIGVMFVMVARVGEMQTSAVVDNTDLDAAVETVVSRIHTVLINDLFGNDGIMLSGADDPVAPGPDQPWDYARHDVPPSIAQPWAESVRVGPEPGIADDVWLPGTQNDIWLASLEPVYVGPGADGIVGTADDEYYWPQITDLWGTLQGRPDSLFHQQFTTQHPFFTGNPGTRWVDPPGEALTAADWNIYGVSAYRVIPKIIRQGSRTEVVNDDGSVRFPFGARADASGDGVADSRWVIVPNLTTSRGKPVYVAVRIIDNCAMLNLNTAFGFYQNTTTDPWHSKSWYVHLADSPYGIETAGDSGSQLGRILGEVNYGPFLRGDDRGQIQRIRLARNPDMNIFPDDYYNEAIRNIESPGGDYRLFDIGDELEMRNRYLLTSRTLARFEKENIAYDTFDHSRGEFVGGWNVALRVKRVPYDGSEVIPWTIRVNSANFDGLGVPAPSHPYYYDRRHISTFYSFDRPLRSGRYPLLDAALATVADPVRRREIEAVFRPLDHRPIDLRWITNPENADRITANTPAARRNVLHLLYAFRAHFLPVDYFELEPDDQLEALQRAARQSAQAVVNLIDFVDTDSAFTVMDTDDIYQYIFEAGDGLLALAEAEAMAEDFGLDDAVVYGYERQPFISEIYCDYDSGSVGSRGFAIELVNPYDEPIQLDGWRIRMGTTPYPLAGYTIPAGSDTELGRLTLWAGSNVITTGTAVNIPTFGLITVFLGGYPLTLQRQHPEDNTAFVTVDSVGPTTLMQLVGNNVIHSIKRDDTQWRFTNADAYRVIRLFAATDATLGRENGIVVADQNGYQLPVADDGEPIERLADFIKVSFVANQHGGTNPQTITRQIANAADESDIRFDVETQPELLDYICFLNRPDKGSLPGRININTAALHVIAAAIPPQLVMTNATGPSALQFAQAIVNNRPYQRVSDLLEIEIFKQYKDHSTINVGDQGVRGDFEERDWIVSRLANIFTVRSDTFTAYILVRLGHDGPQRRMIAIFDRSQVWTPNDRPRLVALHPVPEAR